MTLCGWTVGLAPRLKRKLNKLCNSNLLDTIYGARTRIIVADKHMFVKINSDCHLPAVLSR